MGLTLPLKKNNAEIENPQLWLENYLIKNYDIRFNILTGEYVDLKTGKNIIPAFIKRNLSIQGKSYSKSDIQDTLDCLDEIFCEWNPIQDYFKKLPIWDGKDHISEVLNMIELDESEDRVLFTHHMKKFFLRAVNTGMGGGQNKNCPVFVSSQNAGKTSFQEALVPKMLELYTKTYHPTDDIGTKDFYVNFWLIVDELRRMGPTSLAVVKSSISSGNKNLKVSGTLRKIQRCASMIFNTNDLEFLTDPSGNTRFIPFIIRKCDYRKLQKYELDKFWAHVYSLWKQAIELKAYDSFLITDDEEAILDEKRKPFYVVSRERLTIQDYLEPAMKADAEALFMTAEQICDYLRMHYRLNLNALKIGHELKLIGFTDDSKGSSHIPNIGSRKGYFLKFKTSMKISHPRYENKENKTETNIKETENRTET